MPLYGFLGEGAVAFLSGFHWPHPANGEPGDSARALRAAAGFSLVVFVLFPTPAAVARAFLKANKLA